MVGLPSCLLVFNQSGLHLVRNSLWCLLASPFPHTWFLLIIAWLIGPKQNDLTLLAPAGSFTLELTPRFFDRIRLESAMLSIIFLGWVIKIRFGVSRFITEYSCFSSKVFLVPILFMLKVDPTSRYRTCEPPTVISSHDKLIALVK